MVTVKRNARFVGVENPAPKTQTEVRRQVRSISYNDATLAVEWLNATQKSEAYRRVFMVHQELEALGTMLNELRQKERARELRNKQPIQIPLEETPDDLSDEDAKKIETIRQAYLKPREQFRKRHNAFNKLLASYAYVPVLDYSSDYSVWRFNAKPKRLRRPEITVNDGSSRVRVDESTVIAALCRLAANRELFKVRLCAQCEKHWRVSERAMDRFCGQKCRESFNAKSPEFHQRKAANQRKYRKNLKSLQARNLV